MVIAILSAGIVVGLVVDWAVPAWIHVDLASGAIDDGPEPTPNPLAPEWAGLERLADQGQWGDLCRAIPGAVVRTWGAWGATTLAVLTGACWLAFAMQSIQPRSPRDWRLWAPLMAAALGVVSIWPTVFFIFWQERRWGLVESDELTQSVRFFVLGVGLREELSKFVCFLPLLPWLVRRRDELAALIVAGSVGLGFAMEENINYIAGSVGTATLGRLLMPAPMHMAMTGLIGLAAYRACVWPRECGPQFIAMFGVVVLGHGLYDVFAGTPAVADLGLVSTVIFVVLIYQFFRELRPKQKLVVEPVSLTANFLFCVSTVAAATFVYLCAAAGWRDAAHMLGNSIAAQGVMVYLFLREMPETMVTV